MNTVIFSEAILPLLGAMLVEGGSIPFPGILVVLAFGSTVRPSFQESVIICILMATVYTLASFIPYAIGRKFGVKILTIFDSRKNIKASIEKSKELVKRYGVITIAISRFFGWGNKISYIAGISKIKYLPYGLLTFTGIFSWALVMMNLGKVFRGDTSRIINGIEKYTVYLYVALGVVSVVYLSAAFLRYKLSNKTNDEKDSY